MNDFYYNAGTRIRRLRNLQHMTREELAEKADISAKFLYEIEMGHKGFSADTLYRIANALSVNSDFILTGAENCEMNSDLKEVLGFFDPSQIFLLKQLLEVTYKLCISSKK